MSPEGLLDRMSPGDILPVLIVGMAMLTAVIVSLSATIMTNWRKVRERQIVASLIQDMLDRNMSPSEIQQVMGLWAKASGSKTPIPDVNSLPQTSRRPPVSAKPVV